MNICTGKGSREGLPGELHRSGGMDFLILGRDVSSLALHGTTQKRGTQRLRDREKATSKPYRWLESSEGRGGHQERAHATASTMPMRKPRTNLATGHTGGSSQKKKGRESMEKVPRVGTEEPAQSTEDRLESATRRRGGEHKHPVLSSTGTSVIPLWGRDLFKRPSDQ